MPDLVPGHVAHAVPTRIRIKVERHLLTEKLSTQLRLALAAMPEVDDVKIQPSTGSITVYCGLRGLDPRVLADRLGALGLIDLDPTSGDPYVGKQAPMSETAHRIHSSFHSVDMRLYELTKGRWNLRSAVPFAFGALALRALIADAGALGAAPWYVLAWYAFDSFWKLNQGHAVSDDPDAESHE